VYNFTDKNILEKPPSSWTGIAFGLDFNVAPLCGVLCLFNKLNRTVYVVDEYHKNDNGRTSDACNWARPRIEHYRQGLKLGQAHFIGDASGGHRDTRGNVSDLSIMQQELRACATPLSASKKNPLVIDRINAVNTMLDPAVGQARLLIHPRCKHLIDDMQSVKWKDGTRDIDKSDSELTHISDSLGYVIYSLFPAGLSRVVSSYKGDI
jgi:hypothetical protein